jgi:membrane protease YdiL (CAAX protease family)
VAVLWVALSVAGWWYARALGIPRPAAIAALAALLVEAAFYIVPGFEAISERLRERGRDPGPACVFAASGLAPYLLYASLSGTFRWDALATVAGRAAVVSLWFVVLPRSRATDVLFLAVMAAVYLAGLFKWAYIAPAGAQKLPAEILGRLMWIRLGIAAALFPRRAEDVGFGFLPRLREWKIGFLHYLAFLPVCALVNYAVGFAHVRAWPQEWWKLLPVWVATFLGMLWVSVLAEEFFFRGLLQRWIQNWTRSPAAALVIASAAFGAAHLPFRSAFPNWRFAILALGSGLFYGRAYQEAGSIRAAMVTHVLVNITWRVFFA